MNKEFKIGDYVKVSNSSHELYWTDFVEIPNQRGISQFRVILNKDKTYKVSEIRDNDYLILDGVGHNCTTTVTTTLPTFHKAYFVEDVKKLRKEKLEKINKIKSYLT